MPHNEKGRPTRERPSVQLLGGIEHPQNSPANDNLQPFRPVGRHAALYWAQLYHQAERRAQAAASTAHGGTARSLERLTASHARRARAFEQLAEAFA